MARTTGIEWTEHTWNPLLGCSLESAGCTNCYAMRLAYRLAAMGQPAYADLTRRTKAGAVWTGALRQAPPAQTDKPRRIRRPAVIFVNSMSDLFHPDAPDAWRDAAYRVMLDTPRHVYQVLTKRPAVAAGYYRARPQLHGLAHIWIGASVENARVTGRIDILRTIPAGLRFLSVEPLLGPVGRLDLGGISWVITGGESGPGARPCRPDWVRDVRDQCASAGVAFFHKQWGTYASHPDVIAGRRPAEVATYDAHGKGGALLDGRLWRQVPPAAPRSRPPA
jgi:protein gp37